MRYYKELGNEYVENGTSKIRGATIETITHPNIGDRMVRIFTVQEVIRTSELNLIEPGMMIGLSFPVQHINSRDYTWKRDEERMCPLKLELHQ